MEHLSIKCFCKVIFPALIRNTKSLLTELQTLSLPSLNKVHEGKEPGSKWCCVHVTFLCASHKRSVPCTEELHTAGKPGWSYDIIQNPPLTMQKAANISVALHCETFLQQNTENCWIRRFSHRSVRLRCPLAPLPHLLQLYTNKGCKFEEREMPTQGMISLWKYLKWSSVPKGGTGKWEEVIIYIWLYILLRQKTSLSQLSWPLS